MELASIINTVTIWFLFQIGSFELTYSDGDLGGKETTEGLELVVRVGGFHKSIHG